MYEAKSLGPKLRTFFVAAFSFGLLLMAWSGYVRGTQHPAPRWTEHLPIAFMSATWALFVVLCPMPGMTRNMAKAFLVIFTAACALELYFFFF